MKLGERLERTLPNILRVFCNIYKSMSLNIDTLCDLFIGKEMPEELGVLEYDSIALGECIYELREYIKEHEQDDKSK